LLVLSDHGAPVTIAIEAPFSPGDPRQPTGAFLVIDPNDPAFEGLLTAVEATLPKLEGLPHFDLAPGDVYVFGPFEHGDAAALRSQVEGSAVMAHLTRAIDALGGGVSASAPLFLVTAGPSIGTIEALYHPPRRAVMEPLWGDSGTNSLAHELVHAYLDTVATDRARLLSAAADYLEDAHPVLHGQVVSDLYERLGREGRAEESLAFIVGAIAAHQTQTVSSQLLLANPGNQAISEAILFTDVRLLVEYGLLPPCMTPPEGATGRIDADFYDEVAVACD
jgi:hypothetical protein